ncbi:MAG: flagellar hook-length control protein FliK [Lachnospiraceae bacterium]|nr:flagellar hook-length control protein FliK [Lachnospiraceae bacterium]
MTTSGVQVAGIRTAGVAGGARAGNRAAGNGSFADLMSVGSSAKKEAPTSAPKPSQDVSRRPQSAESPTGITKDGQSAVQDKKEDPKLSGQGMVKEDGKEGVKTDGLQDGQNSEDTALSQPDGEAGLDTEFAKSLKLFREAARTLEALKLGELKQEIMDSMQIDEEDLEQLLEQLGTNMQGLLQPQMLQQLVVAVECKGDPMGLLTSETAMNDLKMLLAKAEEIRTELLENQEIPQMPKQEGEQMDFLQVLSERFNQDKEDLVKSDGDGADLTKGRMALQKDAGFTFEAVRESGEAAGTEEAPADGKSSESGAKTEKGTMAQQFLNLVADAAGMEEVEFSQLTRSEQVRAVAEQILEKVRVVLSDTQTSMEISLTPESLGRVTLNLVSRHGALTAHFTAQNEIAKEAIESQMVVLRENLESQGLKVEAIEVTVSNFDFTKNGGASSDGSSQGGQQRNRRGIRFDEGVGAEGAAGMSEAEQITADLMERSGNQVNYTA